MREEVTLAIDELRLRPTERNWFIPVLLNNIKSPSLRISSAEELSDIQAVNLYDDWNTGFNRNLRVLGHDNPELSRVWNLIDIVGKPFDKERLHAIEQLGGGLERLQNLRWSPYSGHPRMPTYKSGIVP
jgi:hypothetical protein